MSIIFERQSSVRNIVEAGIIGDLALRQILQEVVSAHLSTNLILIESPPVAA